jgi:Arm DNA-binding domain
MLTSEFIDALQAGTKPRKMADEKGLYLFLAPSGRRLWRFRHRFPPRAPGNKPNTISLGQYPEVSLEEARQRREAVRRDIAHGVDPSLRRKCERICVGETFEFVSREFISVLRAANISAETHSKAAVNAIRQH